jgi:hypothetical protein
MFRNNASWLLFRVKKTIAESHSDLNPPPTLNNFVHFLGRGKNGLLITLGVCLFFTLGSLCDFSLLNFIQVNKESAEKILDQRTSNIATIFSISLVVIGFLLNNLAIKEPLAYRMLFKYSYFYQIIYFTLSVIACLVVLSNLRDHLDTEIFIRATLIGSYLMIVILVLIAVLFKKIINYVDSDHINSAYKQELLVESKSFILSSLFNIIGKKKYSELLDSYGCERHDPLKAFYDSPSKKSPDSRSYKKKHNSLIIQDINLKNISEVLTNAAVKKSEIVYEPVDFEKTYSGEGTFFWETELEPKLNSNVFVSLNSSFILAKKMFQNSERSQPVRIIIDDLLLKLIHDGKVKEIEFFLNTYIDLLHLQIRHVDTYGDPHSPSIIDGFQGLLYKCFDKAIQKKQKEILLELTYFCSKALSLALSNRSLNHFHTYASFPSKYYQLAFTNKGSSSVLYEVCSERAAMQLRDLIWLRVKYFNEKSPESTEIDLLNKFYYHSYLGFSSLLYNMIWNRDYEQFERALNSYDQIPGGDYSIYYQHELELQKLRMSSASDNTIELLEKEYKNEILPQEFNRHVLVGISCWLYFLHYIDQISTADLLKFTKSIRLPYVVPKEKIKDILFFRTNIQREYMNWENWDFMKRPEGRVYSPPNPHDWLTIGFVVLNLRKNDIYINPQDFKNPRELNNVEYLVEDIKKYCDQIKADFSKWAPVLEVKKLDELEVRIKNLLSPFQSLKKFKVDNKTKEIANSKLNSLKIKEFQSMIGKAWQAQAKIHSIFKNFGAIKEITDKDIVLKYFGQRVFFEGAKISFIDGDNYSYIYGMDQFGGEIGRRENDAFLSIISQTKESESIMKPVEAIEDAIKKLNASNYTPNVIILPFEYSLHRDIINDTRFVPSERKEGVAGSHFQIGTFSGIAVYPTSSLSLKNKILIAQFEKAFLMKQRMNANWFEKELTIDVIEVSKDEANRKFGENKEKWLLDSDGNSVSESAAVELIQTSVIIDIGVTEDFEILSTSAYLIYGIDAKINPESFS